MDLVEEILAEKELRKKFYYETDEVPKWIIENLKKQEQKLVKLGLSDVSISLPSVEEIEKIASDRYPEHNGLKRQFIDDCKWAQGRQ